MLRGGRGVGGDVGARWLERRGCGGLASTPPVTHPRILPRAAATAPLPPCHSHCHCHCHCHSPPPLICSVLGPVVIGHCSKVGAGSVVATDLPEHVVAVGVPARVIKRLDEFEEPVRQMDQVSGFVLMYEI